MLFLSYLPCTNFSLFISLPCTNFSLFISLPCTNFSLFYLLALQDGRWTYSIDHNTMQDGDNINNWLDVEYVDSIPGVSGYLS